MKYVHCAGALLLLPLLACGRPAQTPAAAPEPAPGQPAEVAAPAAGSAPFYVGRWAAREELCRDGAWVITREGIDTAGEVSCRFEGEPEGAGPVEVDAICTAEGPPQRWRLRIAYAESARSLLIENGPFAPVGLVRCSEEPGAGPGAVPEAPFTETSAQGAANVVQTFFALVEAGREPEVRRLWSDPEAVARFASQVADFSAVHATIEAPGRIEGAAGSLYVDVPIEVHGPLAAGGEGRSPGTVTLRRSNDVPGSTAEERRWRIYRITLKDRAEG